jgi:aspartate aminotransferase
MEHPMTIPPLSTPDSPVYAVPESNLTPVSEHLVNMAPIPASRMFLINKSLKVYQQKNPRQPGLRRFPRAMGEPACPVCPKNVWRRRPSMQIENGTAYDMPFGTDAYRKVCGSKIIGSWMQPQVSVQQRILATVGGRDALVKAYQAMLALGYGRQGDVLVVSRVPWISYNWGAYGMGANVLWAPGKAEEGLGLHGRQPSRQLVLILLLAAGAR